MPKKNLTQRVSELEVELADVKKRLPPEEPDWAQVVGIFGPEDSEAFDEAMRLGREYRESLRSRDNANRNSVNSAR